LGQYRASHTASSKGKRSKKRTRQEAKLGKDNRDSALEDPPPSPPDVSRFVAVGLNSITRVLEAASQKSRPKGLSSSDAPSKDTAPAEGEKDDIVAKAVTKKEAHPVFSAVFVSRHSQPSILHAHLPQLVATASLAHPESPAIRLVQLTRGSEERLCEALGLPRVSFIGLIEGAPHSGSLVDLIRDCVSPVEVPWLVEAKEAKYLPAKINSIETFAPVVKKK
jgi:ribonuclease P/MRP protein subunit POP3